MDPIWPHFIPFWPLWPLGALKIELHPMGQWVVVPISTNWAGLTTFESKSLSSPSQKLAIVSHFEFSSEFNHQLNTFLLFSEIQMSYFVELPRLRQFFSTIQDNCQVCRVKNRKNKIFKLQYLKFHHFAGFGQLFSLFLPYIIKFHLFQRLSYFRSMDSTIFNNFYSQKDKNTGFWLWKLSIFPI